MMGTNCATQLKTMVLKKQQVKSQKEPFSMDERINDHSIRNFVLKPTNLKILKTLLKDKTTQKNIVWTTNEYSPYGSDYVAGKEITPSSVSNLPQLLFDQLIQPRLLKPEKFKLQRTREMAEVFTPSWVCNLQNNIVDNDWFGRKNVFNQMSGKTWKTVSDPISFPSDPHKSWKKYVDSRRLEITCGEAPYLTSRYDVVTGKSIAIRERIGTLDRKLRVVNENTENELDWFQWAKRAYQSTYGYEYQGDSLLIARINLLLTFAEDLKFRWHRKATVQEMGEIANIISWNIWQMDGRDDTVPYGKAKPDSYQISFDELFSNTVNAELTVKLPCRIMNWRAQRSAELSLIKEMNMPFADKTDCKGRKANMKFDVIIGNPPYQEETESDSTRKPPIYNFFMEQAYKIGNVVELITPARFLFNAGYTPKAWNEKMLNDPHFKVMYYEPDCTKVFPNTDIKGGIVISYRDTRKDFGAIGTFMKYPELNKILYKIKANSEGFLDGIIAVPLSYHLSDLMKNEHPDMLNRLRTSAFTNLADIFFEAIPKDGKKYIGMVGLLNGKRIIRYVRKDYIEDTSGTLNKWTLLMPEASGKGEFGEILGSSMLCKPGIGFTQTFIGIGKFDNEEEAKNVGKYVKTKFVRSMVGTLKVTQHNHKATWKNVPLQDFTNKSDIDWTKSISDIDQQLYKKYGFDEKEINFIETKVKGME
jgi:type II restriction enzyme